MTIASYNVANNWSIYKRLIAELTRAFPDPDAEMDFVTLEKLPFLVSIHHTAEKMLTR